MVTKKAQAVKKSAPVARLNLPQTIGALSALFALIMELRADPIFARLRAAVVALIAAVTAPGAVRLTPTRVARAAKASGFKLSGR